MHAQVSLFSLCVRVFQNKNESCRYSKHKAYVESWSRVFFDMNLGCRMRFLCNDLKIFYFSIKDNRKQSRSKRSITFSPSPNEMSKNTFLRPLKKEVCTISFRLLSLHKNIPVRPDGTMLQASKFIKILVNISV